jgi:thiol-disulfide isomerase/thioredoxin
MFAIATPRVSGSILFLALGAVATLALLGAGPAARAQEPQTQPASRPASQPSNPEADQRARKIIDEALAKYRAAKNYQDKLAGRMEIVATDKKGADVGQANEYASSLLFSPPNRIAFPTDNFTIQCDGQKLWLYTAALDQYTEAAAPERLDYEKLTEELMAEDPPHPILYVLGQADKKFAELFPMVREFTAVTREERDGRPGQRLAGLFDASQTPFELGPELVPFSLWFDEKTGLLGELRLEFTAAFKKMLGLDEPQSSDTDDEDEPPGTPKHVERAVATMVLSDVKLDVDIPADRFVYKPGAGVEKVAKFDWEKLMQPPNPRDLIGKPAPTFAGNGLDEKPLDLEKLRGRVVVLDFWATWCVPCVQAMPQLVKVAEKFADQPVTLIGINQDAKGNDKKVKQFVADKKMTFRQFLDPTNKLGRQYKVAGIPCTFLLDRQGVVQDVRTGYTADLEAELGKALEKLLKGENLYDPAALAKERAAAKEDGPPQE